ncbi:hypothetical protein FLONG3_3285 [Fusarium longipes]|uniref:Uncharacterized protein n=1 Tax=Fusarium longipes TaxID=694270 RepID=A0A395T1J3_9HYPO|nr:hypothetical protein FLONG3_3285 [Fusarium longipes]
MPNEKETMNPDPQTKGKGAAPVLKGILKTSKNAPSTPNATRQVEFSWEASRIIYYSPPEDHEPSQHGQ